MTSTAPHPPKRKRPDSTAAPSDGSKKTAGFGNCPNVSERYSKLGRIGEGTYGVVYQARDKETGQLVALKRCLPHHESTDGFPVTTLREIQTLRNASRHHTNIVSLLDIAVSSSRSGVFLVFEYCPHDLAHLVDDHYRIQRKSPFREPEVKRLLQQLLSALTFLHTRHIIHRDIKMSNLLYSNGGELKLADFGLSRTLGPALTPKVVSLWYRPPELLFGALEYSAAVDVYGTGCVLAELLSGVPLMNGKDEMEQIRKMFDLLGKPEASAWPDLFDMPLIKDGTVSIPQEVSVPPKDTSLLDRFGYLSSGGLSFLSRLLSYDPSKRGSAGEALEDPYFSEQPTPTHPRLMPKFPSKHGSTKK